MAFLPVGSLTFLAVCMNISKDLRRSDCEGPYGKTHHDVRFDGIDCIGSHPRSGKGALNQVVVHVPT